MSRRESHDFIEDEPLSLDRIPMPTSARARRVSIKSIPERASIPASESLCHFSVLVGLEAPSLSEGSPMLRHAPIDLVMVLDVSGSMHGSKLALLKRAVNFVIDNLSPSDRLSVVSFSSSARIILHFQRMTEQGRFDAKHEVDLLQANGSTDVVNGLEIGVMVLERRLQCNPVACIMFLSDGRDTRHYQKSLNNAGQHPRYLHLLPQSIYPCNNKNNIRQAYDEESHARTFPVYSFGFGSDHDPQAMYAISDASGGTFSFIESYEIVQDAFASCLGGLLSVQAQRLQLVLRSASRGVEIITICSGRYKSKISNQGSKGKINIGDLYADEDKEFLIYLSVPEEREETKTPVLDVSCSYRDAVSKETVLIEAKTVVIQRPKFLSVTETVTNLEVDRQRNRINAAQTIVEAQKSAETGNLAAARTLLSKGIKSIASSVSSRAGDCLSLGLEAEMREIEKRMANLRIYEDSGRAYALSSISSDSYQRATTRGSSQMIASAREAGPSGAALARSLSYMTPNMFSMVKKSRNSLSN